MPCRLKVGQKNLDLLVEVRFLSGQSGLDYPSNIKVGSLIPDRADLFYFIMWDKIKNFFKKIWWVVLVPVGILLVHLIFRKETPELDRLIKDKKKEIDKTAGNVEKAESLLETSEESLERSLDEASKTTEQIESDALKRDQRAEEFFK